MTTFNNDKVRLRALEPTDVDWLYTAENDSRLWAVTDTVAPFSRQLMWQYLKDYNADIYHTRELRLVVEQVDDGRPVGTVDLMNFSPLNSRAELGVMILPQERGQGLAQAAVQLICDYAAHHLGLHQLYTYVTPDNEASLAMCKAAGFVVAGTLRQWVKRGNNYTDAVLMQLIL